MKEKYSLLKKVGYAEAASYIILLLIAMPLKYIWEIDEAVKYTGWAHGILFIAYLFFLLTDGIQYKWKFSWYLLGFIAALLPFGPLVFDKKILEKENRTEQS
jgi:integral membrane protein